MDSLRQTAFAEKVDVVVSCLASRTGGIQAREAGARTTASLRSRSAIFHHAAGLVGH